MVIAPISRENIRMIENLVNQAYDDFDRSLSADKVSNASEAGNRYLLMRDLLWLSHNIDIRDIRDNKSITVDEKEANGHYLGLLKKTIMKKGMGLATESLLDEVVYGAEARNGNADPDVVFILDSIKDQGAYSIKKARGLIGEKTPDERTITGAKVYDTIVNNLHKNFMGMKSTGKGLLTFRALLNMTKELDIFADFYIPAKFVGSYREQIKESRKKMDDICDRLYQKLSSNQVIVRGKRIKVRKLTPKIFSNTIEKIKKGEETSLDPYFPFECRKINELAQNSDEKYLDIIDKSIVDIKGKKYFSAAEAKKHAYDAKTLFNIFDNLRVNYTG